MGTTADKLAYTKQAKEEIRAAIVAKGVQCPGDAPFGTFDEYIEQISGEGGSPSIGVPTVVATGAFEVGSGTSLSCSIEATAGDKILATISVRSALVLPENLTLLNTSADFVGGQTLSFAHTTVTTSGTQTFNIGQASAQRIYVNLIVLRGAFEFKYTGAYYTIRTDTVTSSNPVTPPAKPQSKLLIWGCSAYYWLTSTGEKWYTSPDNMPSVSLSPSATMPRLYNFIEFINFGEPPTSHTFWPTPSSGGSPCCVDAVEITPI